jgi:hypothetical protein
MVGLDLVVGVPLGAMPRRREEFLQHGRIGRCPVGDDLDRRSLGGADGLLEEPAGCLDIALCRDEDIDDLAELVDRAVHVAPPPGHLDVGFVNLPAIADGVPAQPGGLGEQRREPLDPAVDGDVVDLYAPAQPGTLRRRGRTGRSAGPSGLRRR